MKQTLKDQNAPIRPYFVLCLFGGIRPEEAQRMTWGEHVKMDTKEIYVTADISKTKRERMFAMPELLHLWLQFCSQNDSLIPANFRRLKDGVVKSLEFDWIQDGLRHTFATFHYAKHKSLDELRHIMGNSPNVIERFYKGAISKKLVETFWTLTPTVARNMGEKGGLKDLPTP